MFRESNRFRRRILIIYVIALTAMLGILIAITVGKDKSHVSYGLDDYSMISDGWVDDAGNSFRLKDIDSYAVKGSGDVWAYYRFPQGAAQNQSLMFRSKNAYVDVSMDNVNVYQTDVADHPFYNHSPGTRWNLVSIPSGTREIELHITLAYSDGRAKVDNIYLGDRAGIIINIINEKLFGLVISFLIFFVGLLFILADIVFNWKIQKREDKDNSLGYLGAFALIAAVWCLLETNILQLFSPDLRIIQVMDNMMLVIAAFPLFMYLDCSLHIFRSKLIRVICILDLCYISLSTLSQIAGYQDYHQTLNGAIVSLAVISIVLILCICMASIRSRTMGKKKYNYIAQQLGIIMIALGVAGDLIRYLTSDVMDRAMIIRVGLLAFIICFGAGNIWTLIKLVEQGMHAEIISKLAYSDGLTNVGNRTAYIERLHSFIGIQGKQLGIIMLDINDLKLVNDTLGHGTGDELIKVCAGIIDESFGSHGETYRIGGDEFIVLLWNDKPEEIYQKMHTVFEQEIKEKNESGEYGFCISIACGASFCKPVSMDIINLTQDEADRRMYMDKARMKGRM